MSYTISYSTEPAVLSTTESLNASLQEGLLSKHCLHYLSITTLPPCLPQSEKDPDHQTPSMKSGTFQKTKSRHWSPYIRVAQHGATEGLRDVFPRHATKRHATDHATEEI
jgi:hypothetical protein